MLNFLKSIFKKKQKVSIQVCDKALIRRFVEDEDFPFLVSFPRTGSHWLRILMELYFKKPSLVRIFYYHKATKFTCYHTHDDNLDLMRKNVIYLYRNPVDTIYSQLNYYSEDINNSDRISFWSRQYARHLQKWLYSDAFVTKKTVVTYEELKNNPNEAFRRICDHIGCNYTQKRFDKIVKSVSKSQVKTKTTHDEQVINLHQEYESQRQEFRSKYSIIIYNNMKEVDERIPELFGWQE